MIHSICFDAESGVFPHPSADAQILYGRNCVALQVCPTAFLACFIVFLACIQMQVIGMLMLPVIVWSPLEQYSSVVNRVSKMYY